MEREREREIEERERVYVCGERCMIMGERECVRAWENVHEGESECVCVGRCMVSRDTWLRVIVRQER